MKQIELPTTQNVILKYELPDLVVRIVAFIIDAAIIGISVWILVMLGLSMFAGDDDTFAIYAIVVVVPIYMFYTLVSEILMKGQTLGKKALGIKRIHVSGKMPELSDYVLAWSLRLIEIYSSFGTLAVIFILGSDNNQRLGDRLSNTIVIKTLKGNKAILNEILKMDRKDNQQIVYPQVTTFSEEQMIFMKNCLLSFQKYPNPNTTSILNDLCVKVGKELSVDNIPLNQSKFISQLIKDYVILTR